MISRLFLYCGLFVLINGLFVYRCVFVNVEDEWAELLLLNIFKTFYMRK